MHRVHDRRRRAGGELRAGIPIRGQDPEPLSPRGDGVAERPGRDASALDGEPGPSHAGPFLESGEHVDTAPVGIGVDEQDVAAGVSSRRRPGQGGGERRRSCTTTASDDGDHRAASRVGLGGRTDDGEQFHFAVGQPEDVFGSHDRSGLPLPQVGGSRTHEYDTGPPRKIGGTRQRRRVVHHDDGGIGPGTAGRRRDGFVEFAIGGRSDAAQRRDQSGIVGQPEDVGHVLSVRGERSGGTAELRATPNLGIVGTPVDKPRHLRTFGEGTPPRGPAGTPGTRTTLARGEEARVVCVQPRGVGLNTTRTDPGNRDSTPNVHAVCN